MEKIKSVFKEGDIVTCSMFEGIFIVQEKIDRGEGVFITVKHPEDYYHFTEDGRFFKTKESKQVLFKAIEGFRERDIVEKYMAERQYEIISECEDEYKNYYIFSPIGSVTDSYSNSNPRVVEFTEAHERYFLVERPEKKEEEAPKVKRKLSRYLITDLETGENRVTPYFFSEEGFSDSKMTKSGFFNKPDFHLKKYGEEIEVDW